MQPFNKSSFIYFRMNKKASIQDKKFRLYETYLEYSKNQKQYVDIFQLFNLAKLSKDTMSIFHVKI
jgi:hypothetical protein